MRRQDDYTVAEVSRTDIDSWFCFALTSALLTNTKWESIVIVKIWELPSNLVYSSCQLKSCLYIFALFLFLSEKFRVFQISPPKIKKSLNTDKTNSEGKKWWWHCELKIQTSLLLGAVADCWLLSHGVGAQRNSWHTVAATSALGLYKYNNKIHFLSRTPQHQLWILKYKLKYWIVEDRNLKSNKQFLKFV